MARVDFEARDGHVLTVAVAGEMDAAGCRGLIPELESRVSGDGALSRLRVGLAGVTFLDAAGIGALVRLRNEAVRHGMELELCDVPPRVARLLAVTDLLRVFGLSGSGLAAERER